MNSAFYALERAAFEAAGLCFTDATASADYLMRIVFVSWRDLANTQAGGSEVLFDRLAVGLTARGHQVALLCGGPVGKRPYEVVDIGGTYSQYLRAPVDYWRRFRQWDLLVDVENGLPYFSPLWRLAPKMLLVHHIHTDQWAQRFPGPLAACFRFAEAKLMPLVYRGTPFIAISPSTAASIAALGVPRHQIRLLSELGVDMPALERAESEEPLFVCLGRLVPHKRVDLLLRVWKDVRRVTGGRLVVIGDGPERQALELQAGPGVDFLGRVTDDEKWQLLGKAWFLLHSAQHEGWGMVIIEAAAAGTPSIGFDVAGVRDAISDGTTGILVHSEQELATRWIELVEQTEIRAQMGRMARRKAAETTWDRSIDHFERLLAGELSASRAGRTSRKTWQSRISGRLGHR